MIKIENLTKSFSTRAGRHYLFRNVNLEIPPDRNLAILGPNGAGKSTLLRILGGIDYPDSGKVHCPYELSWPLGISGGFIGHLTGRENCTLVCKAYGLRGDRVNERLEYIKELSGIGNYFEEPIRYYSTGMNGRLNFSLSMAFDFDYFLIDEVTSVGDMLFRETAKRALDEKRAYSKVIMVSHSMGTLRDFCDFGIVMKEGEVRLYQDLDEAIKAYFPKSGNTDKKAITPYKGDLDQFFNEAFQDGGQGYDQLRENLSRAIQDLEGSLAVATEIEDEALVYHRVANLFFRLGSWQKSLMYYRKSIYLEEQRLNFYPPFLSCLNQCGLKEEAWEVINRVLGWKPDNPALLSQKVMFCIQRGELDEALQCAREILELEPENGSRWNQLANVHFLRGEYEKALEVQAGALDHDARNPVHWDLLSRILGGLEQWDRAILARIRSRELSKENVKKQSEEKVIEDITMQFERLIPKIH